MKKLFFLSLITAGLGGSASAQLQSKKTAKNAAKNAAKTQQNAKRAAEKLRIENQGSTAAKPVSKTVVVATPQAERIVPQQKK